MKLKDKRHGFRSNFELILKLRSEGEDRAPVIGQTINFSETGACILTDDQLPVGATVDVERIFPGTLGHFEVSARVLWEKFDARGRIYGISFDIPGSEANALDPISDLITVLRPRAAITKYIVGVGIIGVPVLSIALALNSAAKWTSIAFAAFISLVTIERVWETFSTGRQKTKSTHSSNDWTITAVSFYYLLMLLFTTIEFFFADRKFAIATVAGVIVLAISFAIRWWGMRSLGDQWNVHTQEKGPIGRSVVRRGPYNYIRHPIYAGVILELIAIPLIAQAWFTVGFVLLVNIPLQVLRCRLEETSLIENLGSEYLSYMRTVPRFFPKLLGEKSKL